MAEEEYASSEIVTNKRKYYDEDQTTPSTIPRKPTAPAPAPAVGTYNSVPPPMDDFQLAKQKAQEIAARLLNTAADPKKPRLDDTSGFDSFQHKPTITPPVKSSYGYPELSKKIEVPSARVGVIIGKGGETIKYLQIQSGAKIQVTRDVDADPYSPTRAVELMGTPEQIAKAEQLINDVLAEADTGGSGVVSRRITGQVSGAEQFVMKVPNNKVGLVIGKGGETIKNMQARTGARIQVIPLRLPPGDTSTERTVQIDGSSEQIEAAKQLVYEVTSEVFVVVLSLTAHIVGAYQLCEEMSFSSISFLFVKNRVRNPGMTGGYHQQGYQARPPASWAPPSAQMQQPGYGYLQPGAYPGPPLQYNMSQPPYPGYPSQPASGGYASGWDQSTAPNQQTSQAGGAGGYDYYSQQATPQQQQTPGGSAASTDNSVNSYNQQLASGYNQGQGYSQDGYGGYNAPIPQSGYQGPGYDQQQSYSSTAGYGNVSNPTSDGHITSYATQGDGSQAPAPVQSSAMGQQGYQSGQQPSPNPSYPSQGSTQAGYGMPPTSQGGYGTQPAAGYGAGYAHPQAQKPPTSQPAYGQPQQSPSAHGGYAQPPPVQPGYPQPPAAHSGYGPGDSGVHRPPSSGYGIPTAHPGYGAPPMAQPSYGQQPPSYSSTYAGGYSSDGSGGCARGTYDANPASQSAQPTSVTGAPKASPQS